MSQRYTKGDVRRRFETLAKTAEQIGLDVSGWQLEEGSPTQGVRYRLRDKNNHHNGVLYLPQGHLGATAQEAYHTLDTMNNVLWALREAGKL